jgi:hypothetical protein
MGDSKEVDEPTNIIPKKNFFSHVFNYEKSSKDEMFNLLQYTVLAIIPLVILNKGIQNYIPQVDDSKGSIEILAESILQAVVMIIGIYLINRIIIYIPTFSGTSYTQINLLNIILGLLLIMMTIHTKLGNKLYILSDRVADLWEGRSSVKSTNNSNSQSTNNVVRVTQPLSPAISSPAMPSIPTQSMGSFNQQTNIKSEQNEYTLPQGKQQEPDFNQMYQQMPTQLQQANSPAITEPMAANDGFGAFSQF